MQGQTDKVRVLTTPTLDIAASAVQDSAGNGIEESSGNTIHVTSTVGPHNPVHVSNLNAARNNLLLDDARNVAVAEIDSKTYAVVTAFSDSAVSIIDITNPSDPLLVFNVTDDEGDFAELSGAQGITITEIDSKTYAVVTPGFDEGILIMDITDPSNPIAAANIQDGVDDFTDLYSLNGVVIVELDSDVYAVVAGTGNNLLHFINIADPYDPSHVSSIRDLGNPARIALTEINSATYAVVTSEVGAPGRVHILNITDPSNPLKVSNVTGGEAGIPNLLFGAGVDIAEIGSKTYAMVTASSNDVFLIIDITDPLNPLPVFDVTDGTGGFDHIGGANDVAIAKIGAGTYAAVVASDDSAVQMVDIANPSDPLPISAAVGGTDGFELGGARGITITEIDSRTYALVATGGSNGLQIIDISDYAPPVLSDAFINSADGTILLRFDEPVDHTGIDMSKFTIKSETAGLSLALTGATASQFDSTAVSVTPAAGQLVDPSLEDYVLDIGVRAILDTSGNGIAASTDNAITVQDPPTLAGASLDEGTGVLTLAFGEDIDQNPTSDVDVSKFAITESDGTSPVPLTGAAVSSVNATSISLTLDVDPLGMVRMLATPTLDIGTGAVQDAEENQIVASSGNMIHVTATVGPHNPVPASDLTKDADDPVLYGMLGVAVTEIDSRTYAVTTGTDSDTIQIIDITDASNPLAVSNITDGPGFTLLEGPKDVAITEIDSKTYAVVAARDNNAVSIIDITTPASPSLVANVTDGTDFPTLEGAFGVAITEIDSKTYAVGRSKR